MKGGRGSKTRRFRIRVGGMWLALKLGLTLGTLCCVDIKHHKLRLLTHDDLILYHWVRSRFGLGFRI